jgi:shikimate kinase
MGAGKSSVGRHLARRLRYSFEDMDRRIERRTGKKIATIFRERGEESFRDEELREARRLVVLKRRVIAAGGGAFTRPETRALLQQGSLTLWLRCDIDTMLDRVPADGSRPLAGNRAIMRALLSQRESSYRLADVAVDASTGSPSEVAARIARLLRERARGTTRRP